jgi:Putative Actinobacterial Holin-X, holin superfamily III
MADQATVRDGHAPARSGADGAPEKQVLGGIAEFGNDIATLAELQARLTLLDLKECLQKLTVPVALVGAGLVAVIGALPVALVGVAGLLASALKISPAAASLLTGGVVLVVAVGTVAVAASRIPASFSSFRRSREELTRNLAWIRTVLLYSGRDVPRRGR